MRVEIFYFKGCPNHQPTVDLVQDVVAAAGLDADIVATEVTSPADAGRLRFLGSPSVRVDGVDVEPAARQRRDFGFSCRTYDGRGMPDREMLTQALLEAQAGDTPEGRFPGQRAGMLAGRHFWVDVQQHSVAGNDSVAQLGTSFGAVQRQRLNDLC